MIFAHGDCPRRAGNRSAANIAPAHDLVAVCLDPITTFLVAKSVFLAFGPGRLAELLFARSNRSVGLSGARSNSALRLSQTTSSFVACDSLDAKSNSFLHTTRNRKQDQEMQARGARELPLGSRPVVCEVSCPWKAYVTDTTGHASPTVNAITIQDQAREIAVQMTRGPRPDFNWAASTGDASA